MESLATEVPRSNFVSWESLTAVRVATLKAAGASGFDFYLPRQSNEQPKLFRDSGYQVSHNDYERLEIKGIHKLFLPHDQHKAFLRQARENAGDIATNSHFKATERFQTLHTAFAAEVTKALSRIDVGEAVNQCAQLGAHLAKVLSKNDFVPQQLFDVMHHDASTFTHVVNVASYCVVLASALGTTDEAELEEIATGGMLHDIGKRHIPPAILNKPARLNDAEFALVKEHPKLGYCDLCERDDVTFSQLMMVYQHHERVDGTGYPVGLVGSEIHPWGRMCAVIDVFEAFTGERPYRKPAPMKDAIALLENGLGKHFDKEIAKCWIATMSKR